MNATAAAMPDIDTMYSQHRDWLRDWLLRHTRCSQHAADLAQDTFCRLLESGSGIAPRNPRPFLATIARRLLIDDVRRARVERAFLDAHAAVMAGAAEPGPERIAEAIHEIAAVARALDRLPDRARRAYLLSRLDGLGHAEIAARLGVSKSMVKQYVAKAYATCYAATYGSSIA